MKYKMTAVLVALAMMFAGVFVMANGDGTDAGAAEDEAISIAQGETQSFQIMTNEVAYTTANNSSISSYTAAWSVKDNTGDAASGVTVDNITYTVTSVAGNANKGLYDVKVAVADAATAGNHSVTLVFTVAATLSGTTMNLTHERPVKVTVTEKADIKLDSMEFTAGLAGSKKVSGTGLTVGNYNWYAIGLPAGLGMSKDGVVSGLATKAVGSTEYKVTAVENAITTSVPKVYTLSLTLEVKAASTAGSVTLTFTNAKVVGGDTTITYSNIGADGQKADYYSACAEEGVAVSFAVAAGTGSTSVSVTKVVTVDENGAAKDVAGGAITYDLDTSGTGSYKTMVYVNVDGQSAVLVFNLIVLDNVHGAWAPSIVINGN